VQVSCIAIVFFFSVAAEAQLANGSVCFRLREHNKTTETRRRAPKRKRKSAPTRKRTGAPRNLGQTIQSNRIDQNGRATGTRCACPVDLLDVGDRGLVALTLEGADAVAGLKTRLSRDPLQRSHHANVLRDLVGVQFGRECLGPRRRQSDRGDLLRCLRTGHHDVEGLGVLLDLLPAVSEVAALLLAEGELALILSMMCFACGWYG